MVPFVSSARRAIWVLLAVPTIAFAQTDTTSRVCEGAIVRRIVVHAGRPPYSGTSSKWRTVARAVGLHHVTTRDEVIESFLALHVGNPCTEFRRAESERVLRAQPFLSDATVRVVPDSVSGVVVVVTTIDEVPVLVNARFRGIRPEALSLGNENISGYALRAVGHIENGDAYRAGVGLTLTQTALFGHPYRYALDIQRYQVGGLVAGEFGHPFYTDLQRIAWYTGFASSTNFPRFERPAGDALALPSTMGYWDAGGNLRIFGTTTVTLLGGNIGGREFNPEGRGVVVSDSGIVPDTGITLLFRYRSFRVGRIGGMTGIRRVNYQSETGFDALVGTQDVARGAMLGLYVGAGLPQFGEADMLVSGAYYVGAANANAWLATSGQWEGRRASDGDWDSILGSARTAFYWGRAPGFVMVIDDRLSAGWQSRLPFQLSFRDPDFGMPAYTNSGLAGGTRNIIHGEVRWSAAAPVRNADFGFAVFGESGRLWNGDVPYGTNATRTSVGVSLLGAYPTRSKRLYRADLYIPFTRSGDGPGQISVRFGSYDRTQVFWVEPIDVTSARTGTEPSRLFAWPNR
jgi:hypothetical protein